MTILIPAALLLKPMLDSFFKKVGEELAELLGKALKALLKSSRQQRAKDRIKVVCAGKDSVTAVFVELESGELAKFASSVSLWVPLVISRMQELHKGGNGTKGSQVQVVLDVRDLLEKSESQSE